MGRAFQLGPRCRIRHAPRRSPPLLQRGGVAPPDATDAHCALRRATPRSPALRRRHLPTLPTVRRRAARRRFEVLMRWLLALSLLLGSGVAHAADEQDQTKAKSRVLPTAAAAVPGALVHGSGQYALGESQTGKNLLLMEGV